MEKVRGGRVTHRVARRIAMSAAVVLASTLSFAACRATQYHERFILPADYEGPLVVIYGDPEGVSGEVKWEGILPRRIVEYRLPSPDDDP